MSVRILYLVSCPPEADFASLNISPIAIPATDATIGTPPSMRARVEAQMEACEVEPFDAIDSETTRIVYGNFSIEGRTIASAFSASAPWPTSRRLVNPARPVSPEEYGGKL